MVENTSACNLRCKSCPRQTIRRSRRKQRMSLDDVQKVAGEIRDNGIQHVAYLYFGEPFLSPQIRRELEILREFNPDICINSSTNGLVIDTDDKREAALLLDRIQVSLDGIDDATTNRYQRGMDFGRAYANMKSLVEYRDARGVPRPTIIWKYLLFGWNERRACLEQAIELARSAGVDKIYFEPAVSPFYGIPWRTCLGRNRDLANHSIVLRPTADLDPEPATLTA